MRVQDRFAMNKEIKDIIKRIEHEELSILDVPEELALNKDIICAERKCALRIEGNRGYDVINDNYFVEEEIFYKNRFGESEKDYNRLFFESFEQYYDFLDGDIYDNACYRFCDFDQISEFCKNKNIDIVRLQKNQSFITDTIDDIDCNVSMEEQVAFEDKEKNKKQIKKWIERFDSCSSGADLVKTVEKYENNNELGVDLKFFFYHYIFKDLDDKDRFNAIMEYMSTGRYPEYILTDALCCIYGTECVVEKLNYSSGSRQTIYRRKRKLKDYINKLNLGQIHFISKGWFDKNTHYYCERVEGYESRYDYPIVRYDRFFETFDDFIEYRKGNLKDVDLSGALNLKADFSLYETNDNTKLPFVMTEDLNSTISKKYENGKFEVKKEWKSKTGIVVKECSFTYRYFFDFVHFLNGDLSYADLLFCDGLKNLSNFDGLDFTGALMTSTLCERFSLPYDNYVFNPKLIKSFEESSENEATTSVVDNLDDNTNLSSEKGHEIVLGDDSNRNLSHIFYVTDLHLMHRILNAKCKSVEDVIYTVQKIADGIVNEASRYLLIGGDISSDFKIFKIFVKSLRHAIDNKWFYHLNVFFVLGNHELWSFPGKSIDEIVKIYKDVIEENGFYLVQNDLKYLDSEDRIKCITNEELMTMSSDELRKNLLCSQIVLFGGLGFSGYNKTFNADNGIYLYTLDRAGEIIESKKFEALYEKIIPVISKNNAIVLTHTPKRDWSANEDLYKNVVYVSGHTHRNEFYDDGEIRYYYDNQIGYYNNNPHIKSFLIDKEYDCLADYEDGIHEITAEQYREFYRGKNMRMDFNREVHVLYMLKKRGYYCFIHKSKHGLLAIFNGAALKRLDEKNIEYYYDHMDDVISNIKNPLDKYMGVMKKISQEIIRIGGSGRIHGCIIDIDFYNHIYVNPIDMKITGYWALNMIDKKVYSDIPALLKTECPEIYSNYKQLIDVDNQNKLIIGNITESALSLLPKEYLSTDIYKASREIKKMQKLSSNVLSAWYSDSGDKKADNRLTARL